MQFWANKRRIRVKKVPINRKISRCYILKDSFCMIFANIHIHTQILANLFFYPKNPKKNNNKNQKYLEPNIFEFFNLGFKSKLNLGGFGFW